MGNGNWLGVLVALAAVGCAGDADVGGLDEADGVDELRLGAASGTLYFAGCTPAAEEVRVVARPAVVAVSRPAAVPIGDTVTRAPSPAVQRPVVGVALPTRDPHSLRYAFPVLPAGAYQLSVEVSARACAGAIWRGPVGGLFAAGQHDLRFEAIVPRTRLGVLRPGDRSRTAFASDTVPLDPERGPTARGLSVETTLPEQTAYELQLSTERPNNNSLRRTDGCAETRGIVYRERLTLRPRYTTVVPFDLARALPRIPRIGDTPGDVERLGAPRLADEYRRGRPLFLRVVPVSAECTPEAFGASAVVTVRVPFAEVPDATVRMVRARVTFEGRYEPGSQVAAFTPGETTECYRTAVDHVLPVFPSWANNFSSYSNDPLGGVLVQAGAKPPGSTINAGTIFCITPGGGGGGGGGFLGGIANAFGDAVTGAVDGLSWAVNTASSTYESIQQAVVTAVANALTAAGVDCDAQCQGLLKTALQTGMVAMGVPPSLPNFDQLMDQGVAYLAATVAEQANIPPESARIAVQAVVDEMKSHHGAVPGTPSNWAVPAEPGLPETTRLTLGVPPGWLDGPGELAVQSAPFLDASLVIPSGYGTWQIPIVHRPDLAGIAGPPQVMTSIGLLTVKHTATYLSYWYFTQWRAQRFSSSCVLMQYRLHSSDAATPTAVPFLRPGIPATWSTPSMTNFCQ